MEARQTIDIAIYNRVEELPALRGENFFHSRELFEIYASTPKHTPYMLVARDDRGEELGHMLAVVRSRFSWMPPYFYQHCRILGEGDYAEEDKAEVFGALLKALRERMEGKAFYIEVSHLSTKMFGYREFKTEGFFPVKWMSIHNSLHSKKAEERLSERMKARLRKTKEKGVYTEDVGTKEQMEDFMRLLKKHNKLKPKRFIPEKEFFSNLAKVGNARITLTKIRDKAIGCSATVYTQGNAYLWYSASKRKSYIMLHPADTTIYEAIVRAQNDGCQHIFFMDVGLPFRKNPYRDFILRLGGKPVSTYRWFRVNHDWLNKLFSFLYRS